MLALKEKKTQNHQTILNPIEDRCDVIRYFMLSGLETCAKFNIFELKKKKKKNKKK